MPRRAAAACAVVVVVAAGLLVSRVRADSVATDVAGDALYAAAVYAGLVLLRPRAGRGLLGAVALSWCVAVELAQLTGLPNEAAGWFPPIAVVLGTGFDPRDLVVYVLAVASAVAVDAIVSARSRASSGASSRES